MERSRGLFVVLDTLLEKRSLEACRLELNVMVSALKDYRARGFRIIGVILGHHTRADLDAFGFQFDSVETVKMASGPWFPPLAWSVARRFSLNVRRSWLYSADQNHAAQARDAGVRQFALLGALQNR